MVLWFLISVTLVVFVGSEPVFPDSEFHCNKWGKIVSRTAGFIAAGVNAPLKGGQKNDPFTFIVIGANTGSNSNDPLWKAMHSRRRDTYSVFVEPIPFIFKELQANMEKNNMEKATCVNAAISNTNQNLTLYCTGMKKDGTIATEDGFDMWAKQMCSTSTAHLYQIHRPEAVDKYLSVYHVLGMSVRALVKTYATHAPVKIVQIDVEGMDDVVSACYTCQLPTPY